MMVSLTEEVCLGSSSLVDHEKLSSDLSSNLLLVWLEVLVLALLSELLHSSVLSFVDHSAVHGHWNVGESVKHGLQSVYDRTTELKDLDETESHQEDKTDGVSLEDLEFWVESNGDDQDQPDDSDEGRSKAPDLLKRSELSNLLELLSSNVLVITLLRNNDSVLQSSRQRAQEILVSVVDSSSSFLLESLLESLSFLGFLLLLSSLFLLSLDLS